jgi:uncharacterized membrane protein YccC
MMLPSWRDWIFSAKTFVSAMLALWIALRIGLDRPYWAMATASVALIGFPIVDAPDTVWDVVLARVEEITLGIVCTTVIGSIVFPLPLGPAPTARLLLRREVNRSIPAPRYV